MIADLTAPPSSGPRLTALPADTRSELTKLPAGPAATAVNTVMVTFWTIRTVAGSFRTVPTTMSGSRLTIAGHE